jgi:hypothetical protein
MHSYSPEFMMYALSTSSSFHIDHIDYTWRKIHVMKLLVIHKLHVNLISTLLCPNVLLGTLFRNSISLKNAVFQDATPVALVRTDGRRNVSISSSGWKQSGS